jgi:hypothetical protein
MTVPRVGDLDNLGKPEDVVQDDAGCPVSPCPTSLQRGLAIAAELLPALAELGPARGSGG